MMYDSIKQVRRSKDDEAKNFIKKLNYDKIARRNKIIEKNKKSIIEKAANSDIMLENLLKKIDKIKMNQINLDSLKSIGINIGSDDNYEYKSDEFKLPHINNRYSYGSELIMKNKQLRELSSKKKNNLYENVLF